MAKIIEPEAVVDAGEQDESISSLARAVTTAKQGEGLSRRASRIHLFADSAEGDRVQMDREVAVARTGDVMRRLLESA